MYGKGWKKIASLIKTRTVVQIRTHAQKYFLKLTKARQSGDAVSVDGKASGTAGRKVRGPPSVLSVVRVIDFDFLRVIEFIREFTLVF